MEVAVAEEKKKIFRARKTMKISDRQQLESLHSSLSSPVPPLSNSNSSNSNSPSPPSLLVNGTHSEDKPKGTDKETNDTTDSKNSRSATPVSPASLTPRSPPLALSLSLSPSPPSSQTPKVTEDTTLSPSSPFHNLNDILKQMEEEKKSECPKSPSSKDKERKQTSVEVAKTDKKDEKAPGTEKEGACTTTVTSPEDQAPMDQTPVASTLSPATSDKVSGKDRGADEEEDSVAMETDMTKDQTETKASKASLSTATEEKPCSPKAMSTASPTPPLSTAPEPDQDIKEEEVQPEGEKKDRTQKEKEGIMKEEKMEVVSVKKEVKNEKQTVAESSTMSHAPTSTSKGDKGLKLKEDNSSSSGQKRPMTESDEKDGAKAERDGKRQRVQGVELEAQLELKITANSGSRQKLEKFVQKLVEERLKALQLNVFDQGLQDLKDRVEKIDCSTKHQSTINTLQAKIARLAKKFGEANQASENKRKQEVLASSAAKTAPSPNNPPTLRVLRMHPKLEPQSEERARQRGELATSVGWIKKEVKEEEEESGEDKDDEETSEEEFEKPSLTLKHLHARGEQSHQQSPEQLSGSRVLADIMLRPISREKERQLYLRCQNAVGKARSDRYGVLLFRNLVSYENYVKWVTTVNYVGTLGKDALPLNLRETMKKYFEQRFNKLHARDWKKIRDAINEILRVKRMHLFFESDVNWT